MRQRVERAEEAQDRINAPAGANTQGVVSQLRDKVRVRRTPQYMRDDFRTAEAAEAEREAEEQAKQQRRELSRQDLARARSLRELSPRQIEELGQIDPERLEQLRQVEAILAGSVPSTYTAVSPSPRLGQLAPNAQPVQPLQHSGGAAGELNATVPPEAGDHASGTHPGDNTSHAAELGQQLAEESANTEQRSLSAEQLQELLRLGQQQ
jgi:hypothetical protein